MVKNVPRWYIVLAAAVAATMTLSPVPATAGRLVLKNEMTGLHARSSKLAVRCFSNQDDLGWVVIKPGQTSSWKFTTMNIWPFKKTEFKCQLRSGLGTTDEDLVTVYSVRHGFRDRCTGDECIWVAKKDGFYERTIVKDGGADDKKQRFDDVLQSKWVWKW